MRSVYDGKSMGLRIGMTHVAGPDAGPWRDERVFYATAKQLRDAIAKAARKARP